MHCGADGFWHEMRPTSQCGIFSSIRRGPTQRVRTCPKHTNISIYGMRVHGRCFPSSPKKNGKQQRKKLPSLFLMAGRYSGAWPGSGREEGRTNREAARTNCLATTAGPVRGAYRYSRTVLCRALRRLPFAHVSKTQKRTHIRRKTFSTYVGPLLYEERQQHKGCTRKRATQKFQLPESKGKYSSAIATPAYDHYKQGRREAATRILHGHVLKVREGCGAASAYFTVSIAFDTARSAQKHFAMYLSPHRLKINM